MAYYLTLQARSDLADIWSYIALHSETAADRMMDRLTWHFELLGNTPRAGRRRDELRSGYRSLSVGEYLVLYRVRKPGVQISHVIHGSRDLNALFTR